MRFTPATMRSLVPKDSAYIKREGDGFGVMVYPASNRNPKGAKVWYFLYKKDGKNKKIRIGEYPAVSISEARAKASDYATAKKRGELEDLVKKEEQLTVRDLAILYLEKHSAKKNVEKVYKENKRNLEKDVIPFIGNKYVDDVVRGDIFNVLQRIIDRKAPIQSNNVLTVIKKMFNFGISAGECKANPALMIEKQAEKERDRVLDRKEIKAAWYGIDQGKVTRNTINCLRLILVTAQRPGECLSMQYEEIKGDWWTIPREKTKNKLDEHRVFLTPLAKELIGEGDSGPVFPAPKTVEALGYALRRLFDSERLTMDRFTPHDLRRTAATQVAGLGFDEVVIDRRLLNHLPGKVARTYNRYKYDKEKRAMLEAWERELKEIIRKDEE